MLTTVSRASNVDRLSDMSGQPHPGPPPGDHPGGSREPGREPASPSDLPRTGDQSRSGDRSRSGDQSRSGDHSRPADHGKGADGRDLWPRDFGRDGVSGLVSLDRAMRARDVSRPSPAEELTAESVLADLLARAEGRPGNDSRSRASRTTGVSNQPVPHPPPQRNDS